MEEDIKILDETIARNKELFEHQGCYLLINKSVQSSIEHLLQAYKEQEKVIDEMAYGIFTVFKPELVLKYGIENVKEFKEMFIKQVKENK